MYTNTIIKLVKIRAIRGWFYPFVRNPILRTQYQEVFLQWNGLINYTTTLDFYWGIPFQLWPTTQSLLSMRATNKVAIKRPARFFICRTEPAGQDYGLKGRFRSRWCRSLPANLRRYPRQSRWLCSRRFGRRGRPRRCKPVGWWYYLASLTRVDWLHPRYWWGYRSSTGCRCCRRCRPVVHWVVLVGWRRRTNRWSCRRWWFVANNYGIKRDEVSSWRSIM